MSSSWYDASSYCESEGGWLVDIFKSEENQWVTALGGHQSLWIGFNDIGQEGIFVWLTGADSSSFMKFGPGQPDNAFNEDCVQIYDGAGYWNDLACSNNFLPFVFVCKKRAVISGGGGGSDDATVGCGAAGGPSCQPL
jgi:hypothetical protein